MMLFPRALFSFLCAVWSCQWDAGDELLCHKPDAKFNTKLKRDFAMMHFDAQHKLNDLDDTFDRFVTNQFLSVCVDELVEERPREMLHQTFDNERLHEWIELSLSGTFCDDDMKPKENATTRKCRDDPLYQLIRQSFAKHSTISKCEEVRRFMKFMRGNQM